MDRSDRVGVGQALLRLLDYDAWFVDNAQQALTGHHFASIVNLVRGTLLHDRLPALQLGLKHWIGCGFDYKGQART